MEKQWISCAEALKEQLEILVEKSRGKDLTIRESIDLAHEISNIVYELRKENDLYSGMSPGPLD